MPFQAVRFQATWKNVGAQQCRAPADLDRDIHVWEIRRPAESIFTRIKSPVFDASGLIINAVPPMDRGEPVGFKPGHRLSVCRSMAAEWRTDQAYPTPFFTKPGIYQFTVCWIKWGESSQNRTELTPVTITVQEPHAEDIAICQAIADDRELLRAFLAPTNHFEPRAIATRLEAFIAKHPNSTYSDYARFALARGITELEPSRVDREQNEKALAFLQGIDVNEFAHGPEVLVLQRAVYEAIGSSVAAKRTAARLDLLFPDDYTRLEDRSRRLTRKQYDAEFPRAPQPQK